MRERNGSGEVEVAPVGRRFEPNRLKRPPSILDIFDSQLEEMDGENNGENGGGCGECCEYYCNGGNEGPIILLQEAN